MEIPESRRHIYHALRTNELLRYLEDSSLAQLVEIISEEKFENGTNQTLILALKILGQIKADMWHSL